MNSNNWIIINHPQMSKIFSSILLLLFLFVFVRNCNTQINTMGCRFYVTPNDANCSTLTLQRCQWEICTLYVRLNNITSCIRYETITRNFWGECMDRCCPNTGPQTYGTLQQCIDLQKRAWMIAGIVIGGVFGLAIIICILIWLRKKIIDEYQTFGNWLASCCKRTARIEPVIEIKANPILSDQIGSSAQFESMKKWTESSEKFRNQDENCSICLSNFPNTQLQCKHFYHHRCIADWFNRNNHCPICLREIKSLTIHCSKCWKSQRNFSFVSNNEEQLNSNIICERCNKQNK